MVDRLAELNLIGPEEVEPDVEQGERSDKPKSKKELKEEEEMKEYFAEVESLKQKLAIIRRNIKSIEEAYSHALVAIDIDSSDKASSELEKLVDDTNLNAADIRNDLQSMQDSIDKMKKDSSQYRIRSNMQANLMKKFMDLMREYQGKQSAYDEKYKELLRTRLKIAKPKASTEEIEKDIEEGNVDVFRAQILDTKHAAAKDAFAFVEARFRDIQRLEQSIKELSQLFMDMAILVNAQGELLDQIEGNVNATVGYTKDAVKNMQGAAKFQKKSRKKMCVLIIILLIVLFLLGGGGALGGIFGSHQS